MVIFRPESRSKKRQKTKRRIIFPNSYASETIGKKNRGNRKMNKNTVY
jgi:hypothetical protein